MEPVIAWALTIASGIFGLGMISAVGSRKSKQQKKYQMVERPKSDMVNGTIDGSNQPTAISMAAAGTGNVRVSSGEENLASVGSGSR